MNDRWITEQVRSRIIADSDVKGVNYNIQVYDGVVYLLGLRHSRKTSCAGPPSMPARSKGVKKVVSYVKMRERGATTQVAASGRTPARASRACRAPSASRRPADAAPDRSAGQAADDARAVRRSLRARRGAAAGREQQQAQPCRARRYRRRSGRSRPERAVPALARNGRLRRRAVPPMSMGLHRAEPMALQNRRPDGPARNGESGGRHHLHDDRGSAEPRPSRLRLWRGRSRL